LCFHLSLRFLRRSVKAAAGRKISATFAPQEPGRENGGGAKSAVLRSVGNALLEVQALFEADKRHVLEMKQEQEEKKEQEEAGGPEESGRG
jgi:molybdenum-dependent DNA-binding transcriptional regulator ModE